MLYFILLPYLAVQKVLLQGKLARDNCRSTADSFKLNGCIFTGLVPIMLALFLRRLTSPGIILPALLLAVLSTAFQSFYIMAFRTGPIGLAAVINNFNLVIPLICGWLIYNEKMTPLNMVGIVLMAVSLILLPKRDGGKINGKWLAFTTGAFIASGLNSTAMTVCARSWLDEYDSRIAIILSYAFSAIFSFVLAAITKGGNQTFKLRPLPTCGIWIVGGTLGLYNVLLITALRSISSMILYPVINVLTMLLLTAADCIFFREKIRIQQLVGVLTALICVVLLNV